MTDYKIIRSQDRYKAEHGWLKSFHLFSFAEYFDPKNISFGNLRVFNDDYIAAEHGFSFHPHKEMEIVTILLNGAVSHADTMGNQTKIRAGEVQRMSAGTGLFHSEENKENEELHLYQIWIQPKEKGRTPSYEQKDFGNIKNELQLLVSDKGEKEALDIGADVSIYKGSFDQEKNIDIEVKKGRGIFVYIKKGSLIFNDETLQAEDQLRYSKEGILTLNIQENTEFILIDVKL